MSLPLLPIFQAASTKPHSNSATNKPTSAQSAAPKPAASGVKVSEAMHYFNAPFSSLQAPGSKAPSTLKSKPGSADGAKVILQLSFLIVNAFVCRKRKVARVLLLHMKLWQQEAEMEQVQQ